MSAPKVELWLGRRASVLPLGQVLGQRAAHHAPEAQLVLNREAPRLIEQFALEPRGGSDEVTFHALALPTAAGARPVRRERSRTRRNFFGMGPVARASARSRLSASEAKMSRP